MSKKEKFIEFVEQNLMSKSNNTESALSVDRQTVNESSIKRSTP